MNFEDIRNATSKWVSLHPEFQLIMSDDTECRLQFACTRSELSSFFIICPADGKWVIGTDVDKVVSHLAETKSYCRESTIARIEDILDRLLKEFTVDDENGEDGDEDDDDDDDDDDDYNYGEFSWQDQDDAAVVEKPQLESQTLSTERVEEAYERFSAGYSSNSFAVSRLKKDFLNLEKSAGQFGICGKPRGDNLFTWDVHLTDIPTDSRLGRDLVDYANKYKREPVIEMEMVFPSTYPIEPPFVRVVRPRFKLLTGHVTVGGSICMQMLTKSGWSSVNDIESILVQIRATILSDPNVCLDKNPNNAYTEKEAKDAFFRMVRQYGWDK
jgi:ubiquitin-conjugating enzyme E2 Q